MNQFVLELLQDEQSEKVRKELSSLLSSGKEYVIAVDFDGTLCRNHWPKIGEPNLPIIDAAKKAKAYGAKLILYTCREKKWLCEAVAWCAVRGLKFDAVNANLQTRIDQYGGDCRKVSADEYWDDKAVCVAGVVS